MPTINTVLPEIEQNPVGFRRCFLCQKYSLDQPTDLCRECAEACANDLPEVLKREIMEATA